MLLAACGGSTKPSTSGSPSASSRTAFTAADADKYPACLRDHGVTNFPDPHVNRNQLALQITPSITGSPAFKSAQKTCAHLLSAGAGQMPRGSATAPATPSTPGAVVADCLALRSPCYTPRQLRAAYGIQPLLNRGITGRGQTVVLLEFPPPATGSPAAVTGIQVPAATDIRQDLARFDSMFGLPVARLQVVNTLAHAPSPRLASIEEVVDTEIVHALAPDTAIREVLIPSSYVASPGTVIAAPAPPCGSASRRVAWSRSAPAPESSASPPLR